MIPESSEAYSFGTETCQASFPRTYRSVKEGNRKDVLKICYRKYIANKPNRGSLPSYNLVFLHGTGMNKGMWHSLIDQIYVKSADSGLHINTCVAVDAVNHGESAAVNENYLGDAYDWRDGAYDIMKVVEAERDTFMDLSRKNIIIGHSMGGMIAMYTSYLQPQLFDACVTINPVAYRSEGVTMIRDVLAPKGYMETQFDVPEGESWEKVVFSYMRSQSFFKRFDDKVLKNLIDDEVPSDLYGKEVSKVSLRTSKENTLATYLGSDQALPPMSAVLPYIGIPVIRFLSEKDTASDDDKERLEHDVGDKLETVHFPGKRHILNGEDPELTVKHLLEVLLRRSTAPPTEFPFISIFPKL
ncbi:hypothetical protein ACI3LY_002323 [Candidozyma auris]|uniref:AB hydrolase-1 domain-containing protein n=2 Tax=Candidozyma auris TaxID=498019 RepID=A0A2H0ZLD8_CANAR|nr:hypothetical_protein [[Candida] auris]KND98074.2 hypothetical protein QG37_05148 [[Candida] auris]PIS51434.1 hypothetical protein B9J08_003015 [[Candida] auris]PIS53418.1 hypothetical protein CJI97_003086 [[Candida] auris]PSK75100.1 hypothetical protein CJJ07_005117 [[Candida] auris]QEL59024.1 hypothetical protein CJJ09_001090 [[Candida] auris]